MSGEYGDYAASPERFRGFAAATGSKVGYGQDDPETPPAPASVVGRLHAAATATTPGAGTALLLTVEDAQTVLDLIAELCPEHRQCDACGARACAACGIGDPTGGCEHRAVWFCSDCRAGMCPTCASEVP